MAQQELLCQILMSRDWYYLKTNSYRPSGFSIKKPTGYSKSWSQSWTYAWIGRDMKVVETGRRRVGYSHYSIGKATYVGIDVELRTDRNNCGDWSVLKLFVGDSGGN